MTSLKNNFENHLKQSTFIPALYSSFTRPFRKSLRHLDPTPPRIPLEPAKVSVVVPNYNYKHYLAARLDSILSQTYPLYELIILDDNSTDGSIWFIEDWLEATQKSFPELKIRFIKNDQNSGSAIAQWQRAFREASGDFLWLAEADDLSDPYFLATAMSAFASDDSVLLSYTESSVINARGSFLSYDFSSRIDKEKSGLFQKSFVRSGEELASSIFAIRCAIPNVSAVVFRKKSDLPFADYLESAKKFSQCGDWYFYLQLLAHGKVAYNRASLNFFRVHSASITANSKKAKRHLSEVEEVQAFAREHYFLSRETLSAQAAELDRISSRLA